MKASDFSSFQLVALPEGAKPLVNASARRFLAPFIGRELSPGEAARELGVPVEDMSYRVHRFKRLGLLEQTRTETRKGRALKYYRAPPGFRVPLSALPFTDLLEVFRALDDAPRELTLASIARLAERGGFGTFELVCYRDAFDRLRLELAVPGGTWQPSDLLEDDMPALPFNWVPIHLTFEEAKTLQRDLAAVIARYQARSGEPTTLLGVMMAPLGDK